jgi:hypothetical protein
MDFHLQGGFPYRYSRRRFADLRTLVQYLLSCIVFLSVYFVHRYYEVTIVALGCATQLGWCDV